MKKLNELTLSRARMTTPVLLGGRNVEFMKLCSNCLMFTDAAWQMDRRVSDLWSVASESPWKHSGWHHLLIFSANPNSFVHIPPRDLLFTFFLSLWNVHI